MLSSIRKFSTSIYAKVLLALVIIPFVFWGMGSSFTGGNKNVVVVINDEKYSIEEFVKYIQRYATNVKEITDQQVEESLSIFIGEKLIQKEVDYFKINLSDKSLSNLLKQQRQFKKENKFSRTEYEKFLIKRGITAPQFESNIIEQEQRRQFLSSLAGGIVIPETLINQEFKKENQTKTIKYINLEKYHSKNKPAEEDVKSIELRGYRVEYNGVVVLNNHRGRSLSG